MIQHTHARTHTRARARVCVHARARTHTHMHTCMHACMHKRQVIKNEGKSATFMMYTCGMEELMPKDVAAAFGVLTISERMRVTTATGSRGFLGDVRR